MHNDQDRPMWLRNLRPPRAEPDLYDPAPTVAEPIAEPRITEMPDEAGTGARSTLSRRQILALLVLLWGNVTVLGCLCLLATQIVVP